MYISEYYEMIMLCNRGGETRGWSMGGRESLGVRLECGWEDTPDCVPWEHGDKDNQLSE